MSHTFDFYSVKIISKPASKMNLTLWKNSVYKKNRKNIVNFEFAISQLSDSRQY